MSEFPKNEAATDLGWLDDSSPSYDQMAEMAGVDIGPLTPTPERPPMNIDFRIQAFWPAEWIDTDGNPVFPINPDQEGEV